MKACSSTHSTWAPSPLKGVEQKGTKRNKTQSMDSEIWVKCFIPSSSHFTSAAFFHPVSSQAQQISRTRHLVLYGQVEFPAQIFPSKISLLLNHTDVIKLSSFGQGRFYSQYEHNSEETEVLPILNSTGICHAKVEETAVLLSPHPKPLWQKYLNPTVSPHLIYKIYLALLLQLIKKPVWENKKTIWR